MNYEGVCIAVPATYTRSVKKQIDQSKILETLEQAKSATNAKFPHVRTRRLKHIFKGDVLKNGVTILEPRLGNVFFIF